MRDPITVSVRHAVARKSVVRRVVIPGVLALAALGVLVADGAPASAEAKAKPKLASPEMVELGRRLFFEPLASPSGKRSCASCHLPEHGFSDPKVHSLDDFGVTQRHSQTIVDAAYNPTAHWDGEFATIEELVTARLNTTPTSGSYGGRGGHGGLGVPGVALSLVQGSQSATSEKVDAAQLIATVREELEKRAKAVAAAQKDAAAQEKAGAIAGAVKSVGSFLTRVLRKHGATTMGGQVAKRVTDSGRYAEAFRAAFGSPRATLPRIAEALGAYCRSVEHTESPYDRHVAGDTTVLTASAKRGLALFEGRAGCNQCHATDGPRARLTDFQFHNSGIAHGARGDLGRSRFQQLRARTHDGDVLLSMKSQFMDVGRGKVTQEVADQRAFKTPTLRDVARRGPYMHDGSLATLEEVVRYYASGCGEDPHKDARLKPFAASDQDVTDLVAFLHALSGTERPGLAKRAWSRRAPATRLRFVDSAGKPLPGLPVTVKPDGDVLPARDAPVSEAARVADEDGWVTYTPPATTHARLVLPEGLAADGLIPDTCKRATIKLPIAGRAKISIVFGADQTPPDTVTVEHRRKASFSVLTVGDAQVFVGNVVSTADTKTPVHTTFVRTGVVTVKGRPVARYEGWVRTDVEPKGTLHVPGVPKQGDRRVILDAGREARFDLSQ